MRVHHLPVGIRTNGYGGQPLRCPNSTLTRGGWSWRYAFHTRRNLQLSVKSGRSHSHEADLYSHCHVNSHHLLQCTISKSSVRRNLGSGTRQPSDLAADLLCQPYWQSHVPQQASRRHWAPNKTTSWLASEGNEALQERRIHLGLIDVPAILVP